MAEKNEISRHEIMISKVLQASQGQWLSNKAIAEKVAMPISQRTVRAHTLKLVRLGLLDQAEVFPGHHFRWSDKAGKRNVSYLLRLNQAAEVLGL